MKHPNPSNPHDNSLADVFDAAWVPPHSADFWDNVKAGVDPQPELETKSSAHSATEFADEPILLQKRRETRRQNRTKPIVSFVSIAAATLVIIAGLFIVNSQGPNGDSIEANSDNESQTTNNEIAAFDIAGEHTISVLGSGSPRAINADGTTVLLVDDAPGYKTGCGESELLTIYSQAFDSPERTQLLPDDVVVKAERVEVNLEQWDGSETLSWTDYCNGERRATWTAELSADASKIDELVRLGTFTIGGADDPVFGEIQSTFGEWVLAESADRHRAINAPPDVAVVEAVGKEVCAHTAPKLDSTDAVTGAVWAPDNTTVGLITADSLVLWNCVTGDQKTIDVTVTDNRIVFDPSGERIAFQSTNTDGQPEASVITFK